MKKVMFVSSTGGHLTELMQLKELFENYDYHIVTEKMKSNYYLKEKYPNKVSYYLYGTKDHMKTYPFILFINLLISIYLYLKVRPDFVVTTGAHVGGVMSIIAKIFGAKIIYIETFANIESKSITGKLVYYFADLFLVQWENMLNLYPNAKYKGVIF